MHPAVVCILATILLQAPSVLAERKHHGDGGGGGAGFSHGGGNVPSTFITTTSAAAAAASANTTASIGTGAGTGTGILSTASPSPPAGAGSSSVDASLIPPFDITAGVKANDGTANCVGDNKIAIPCDCPPDTATFVKAVQDSVAGGAAFPPGTSAADQLTRLQTCIVTLQNFKGGAGSGVGCPIVSTTWKELQAQLQSQVK
ncbi:hypothetical protein A1O3_07505 [Capronia epimyces CBS 606.96]|uniref:Uncharacterized protein n=1 Tax=Capronia epimyces CBS 606.96 TaxID=1182542 RepID=W9XV29_9EURO|nr:uncharacterized protein A1O3_07505 [Capronia epimyces CBS 606.96]EXJ81215.1 hypothetical protein A1O3_07505 [Capronia epimyces CBS 606.96]